MTRAFILDDGGCTTLRETPVENKEIKHIDTSLMSIHIIFMYIVRVQVQFIALAIRGRNTNKYHSN